MHIDPRKPNILQDMLASRNMELRNGKAVPVAGRLVFVPTAKRHLTGKRSYPYSSERQDSRQRRVFLKRITPAASAASLIPAKGE